MLGGDVDPRPAGKTEPVKQYQCPSEGALESRNVVAGLIEVVEKVRAGRLPAGQRARARGRTCLRPPSRQSKVALITLLFQ